MAGIGCSSTTAPAPTAVASAEPGFTSDPLDGDVYAAPIVVGGRVFVATEANSVYAFDARSGRAVWHVGLGDPVDASTLPCGDIRPVSGITSTPVADTGRGVLWVVAFLRPAHHVLFALDLASGRIRSQRPADPPGESPATEQQRGALARAGGLVLIAYGGLLGDCGAYHGWVVGVPEAGGDLVTYRVPCGRACGLWSPGGPTVAADGTIWVASGNSDATTTFDHGNALIALDPQLHERGYFAPTEWAQMNRGDADLGSISPVVLDAGHVFIAGKTGTAWIVDAARPGGVGGQLFAGSIGCAAFAGAAWAPPMLYVSCPGALVGLRVDLAAPSFHVAWRQAQGGAGTPVLGVGFLWVIDTASGRLAGRSPADGSVRTAFGLGAVMHFARPAIAGGRVYAAGDRRLHAFPMGA